MAVAGLNLVVVAWAFGGVDAWAQILSAGLSLLAPIRWLPGGMDVPVAEPGPLRLLLLWFAPWALTCALWLGLTRRTTVLALLNVVAGNGFLLAAFGVVQRAAGAEDIYGIRHTQSADIFASFIYRNHAAAYFCLVATLAVALALHGLRRQRQADTPGHGPAVLHFLFAGTALAAVVLTLSLGGLLLLATSWGLLLVVTGGRFVRSLTAARISWPGVLVATASILLVATLAAYSGSAAVREHLGLKLAGGAERSLRVRWLADQQGLKMFADRPVLGWGAGCFRYGFTKYQRDEIEITGTGLRRYFWEHAHNDWLEWLVELGLVGFVPVAIITAYWLKRLLRPAIWRTSFLLWGAAGPVGIALYALFDFPLQNPAVLLTSAGILCLVARWGELVGTEVRPTQPTSSSSITFTGGSTEVRVARL